METGAGKVSLTEAIMAGNLRAVRRYLSGGGDPDRRLSEGSRPLHWASYCGQIEIAEALIRAGASVNAMDADGDTPLHASVFRGHTGIVRLLLQAGAAPALRNASGETPAAYAKSADDAALLVAYRRRPAPAAA